VVAIKAHIRLTVSAVTVDQSIWGKDASEIVHQAKMIVAKRMGGIKGWAVKKMGDMSFARECVKRYDKQFGTVSVAPKDAQAFLQWGINLKLVEVSE
jgi:hypothetical protein